MAYKEKMITDITEERVKVAVYNLMEEGWKPIGEIIEQKPAINLGGAGILYMQKMCKED